MIRSMTGYGEASAHVNGVHYFLDVRTLNNKYFKSTIRLPEEFQALEAELEARLRERISRGSVVLSANCTDESESAAHDINRKALNKYLEQLQGLGVGGQTDLAVLLQLPGVLQPPLHDDAKMERIKATFLGLLDQALDQLLAMREREGRALVEDLRQHHALIAERLRDVAARAPEVVAEYQRRLKSRIETMLNDANVRVDTVDLIKEIAVYAERTDIAEEIKRLTGHLDQFLALLTSTDRRPLGRTLDFLAQEMLREANTIASKSPDAQVSRCAVEIKGAIDRIKEQAANLE